jgi:glycosyltransferase involved in cell wall biosynthesis
VALEAAIHGCNIVITSLGGPKEYYPNGAAQTVNPYSVDEIGQGVMAALEDTISQPNLREQLISKYNVSRCTDRLIDCYQNVIISNKS